VIHVVVPAFNEAGNVEVLLPAISRRFTALGEEHRIVVVDDGSTDATASLCRAVATRDGLPVEVLSLGTNQGPGVAFRTGFNHVLETAAAADLVVTLEGDQTSDPAILARMIRRAREEDDDIVLASCYLYGGGIKGTQAHRVGLSHVANGLMKKALGLSGLATLSSFYRVYQARALLALRDRYGADGYITTRGFECMVEILYRAAQLRLSISEVPMVLDGSRRVGKSKMRVMRTSLAYLRLAARAVSGSL
jgi:dolichol-phosphate mannosyltransferase